MSAQIASAAIVSFPGCRIEPQRDAPGWLVITPRGHAWLHGSRADALREKRWHDAQWERAQ
jgi:hypothetical protein